jgi:riboflavin kinase/FMN adenylyltransferase
VKLYRITDLFDLPKLENNTCVIGTFDGLHIGHQELIKKANGYGLKTLLITFENQRKTNYSLMTTSQKHFLMDSYGVDYLVVFPYELIKNVLYSEFIEILKKLSVCNMICGEDFRFGYNREGSIEDLKESFNVSISEYTLFDGKRASTSLIKDIISSGNMAKARLFLGRNYAIEAMVKEIKIIENNTVLDIDYGLFLLPPNGEYRGKINENNCLIKVFNLSKTDKRVYAYLDSILSIDLDSVITLEFE